jgi:hypothetical protein
MVHRKQKTVHQKYPLDAALQVRFKFTAGGTADSDWIHFRMLQTVWEVN